MKEKLFNNILLMRYKFGMNQEIFAKGIGIARQTLSAIEQGKQNPSVLIALKMAHILEVSVEELFSREKKSIRKLRQL